MPKFTRTLISLVEQTTGPRIVSGEAEAKSRADIYVRIGRTVTTGFTAGVEFRIELSPDASGNFWIPTPAGFTTALGSSVAEEAVNGACVAEQPVIPMASTTDFDVNDYVFVENTTIENSEFGKLGVVTGNTSVTLEDDLENIQTGSSVRDQAESYHASIETLGSKRIRVVCDGSGAGQNFAVEVVVTIWG